MLIIFHNFVSNLIAKTTLTTKKVKSFSHFSLKSITYFLFYSKLPIQEKKWNNSQIPNLCLLINLDDDTYVIILRIRALICCTTIIVLTLIISYTLGWTCTSFSSYDHILCVLWTITTCQRFYIYL